MNENTKFFKKLLRVINYQLRVIDKKKTKLVQFIFRQRLIFIYKI